MDGKLEILAGGGRGLMAQEIRAGGEDLNLKILPQESFSTLTSLELCNGKSCSLSVYSVLASYALSLPL